MKKFPRIDIQLTAILILGFILRVWNLGAKSLWKDEIFSMIESQRSIIDIFTSKTYFFGYAPMHHFFTHLALYFGKSEFVLRLPAVLFGLASIYLIYLLGKVFFNQKTGLLASFLLAISSLHLEYSREVRYYSFLIFFQTLSLYYLYWFLKQRKLTFGALFFIFSILSLATHATALLAFVVELIFTLVFLTPRLKLKTIEGKKTLIYASTGVLLILLALFLISNFGELFSMIKIQPAMPFSAFIKYTFVKLSGWQLLAIGYGLLLALGLSASWKKEKQTTVLLAALFFLPPLALYLLRPPVFSFHIRYIIFTIVPFLLLIARGIVEISRRRAILYLVIILISLLSVRQILAVYSVDRGDWRGVGNYLIKNSQPGDVIVTESLDNKILLDYYLASAKKRLVLKTAAEPLLPPKYPFRIYYLQHDYISPGGKANLETLSLIDWESITLFSPEAEISPMAVFSGKSIFFWQEGESNFVDNRGWVVAEMWGNKVIYTNAMAVPNGVVSYQIDINDSDKYDIYANLRWDGVAGILKYKIDDGEWSFGFQPFYGDKGDSIYKWKMKEHLLGTVVLNKGKHTITFFNQKGQAISDYAQTIDYFYLAKNH